MNDTYLYVDSDGIVVATIWENRGVDDRRRYFGNCFKTSEEAEAAAERVKAALKGEKPEGEKDLACGLKLSAGEAALIEALRDTMIVCAWGHNEVAIVDKELKTRHDCVSFLTTGSVASDDKIRDALNAISREQDAAIEQAEQETNND